MDVGGAGDVDRIDVLAEVLGDELADGADILEALHVERLAQPLDAAALADITWEELIDIGKAVKAKTGHPLLGVDINDAGAIRIMLQSVGKWYFTPDGQADIAGSPTFKAALETYARLLQATDIYKPVAGWNEYTGAFTSGEAAAVFTGVWMTATIKAANMPGQWAVAPATSRSAANA